MESGKLSSQIVEESKLTTSLTDNIVLIRTIFKNNDTLTMRQLETPTDPAIKFCLFFSDGMVNNRLINQDIIRPLLEYRPDKKEPDLIDLIAKNITLSDTVEKTTDMEKIVQAIVYGDTVLLADGFMEALVLNTKGWQSRSIEEPENERILKGPREGFTESLMVNLSLLRRRIRTPDFKMEYLNLGVRTKTHACICYIDGIAAPEVLKELKSRLQKINIDGILDVNYISEIIKDKPNSPIETIGSSERADVIAAKLLEGRVALVVDGTPVVLTVPHLFIEYFQSDEDYFINYMFASINRILRILAFIFSISMPALYLSLATFHQEMLPTSLIMSIAAARQGVPFPTIVEGTFMLVIFEMLRESGSRMPGNMGTALSIVGALVIGQAAVQAKIVSAPLIIIVAVTGIAGLMVPLIKGIGVPLRFILLFLSGLIGLYGYMFGMLAFLAYIFSVTSFGVPILTSAYSNDQQDRKDILHRTSWKNMITRPKYLSPNKIRNASKGDSQ